jgi:hypothetical protein
MELVKGNLNEQIKFEKDIKIVPVRLAEFEGGIQLDIEFNGVVYQNMAELVITKDNIDKIKILTNKINVEVI